MMDANVPAPDTADAPVDITDPLTEPSSLGGWSEDITWLDGALVVPPDVSGFQQHAGVVAADGSYVPSGALWRRFRPLTLEPEAVEGPVAELPGRWLWGGVLWAHFGHFLAESTARLWALNNIDGPIDGILFMPKRPRNGENMTNYHKDFFDLMGIDVPIRVTTEPVRVETLIVPGQGFGLGEISAGTQKVRDHFAASFARNIAPEGPDRLYVSRSALGVTKGSIIGETYMEDRLAEEGYEIFHPQAHSMAVQVARYRAARQVVATDGSALHLLAMAQPVNQYLAIIARRQSSALQLLIRHVASFTRADPLIVDALRRSWFPDGRKANKRFSLGELDLTNAAQQLQNYGYITGAANWQNLTDDQVQSALDATGRGWHLKRWQLRRDAELAAAASGAA